MLCPVTPTLLPPRQRRPHCAAGATHHAYHCMSLLQIRDREENNRGKWWGTPPLPHLSSQSNVMFALGVGGYHPTHTRGIKNSTSVLLAPLGLTDTELNRPRIDFPILHEQLKHQNHKAGAKRALACVSVGCPARTTAVWRVSRLEGAVPASARFSWRGGAGRLGVHARA